MVAMAAAALIEVESNRLVREVFNRLVLLKSAGLLQLSLNLDYVCAPPYIELVNMGKACLQKYFEEQQQQQKHQRHLQVPDTMDEEADWAFTASHPSGASGGKRRGRKEEAEKTQRQPTQDETFGYLQLDRGGEASDFMQRMLHACMVEEPTLLHVARLLRLADLLLADCFFCEDLPPPLLLAVIGELYTALKNPPQREGRRARRQRQEEESLVRETLQQIIGLLKEAGRDRLTYLKEAVSLPDTTPLTEGLFESSDERKRSRTSNRKLARFAGGIGEMAERKFLTTVYVYDHPHRGDACLERMLHSGSLPLLLERMQWLLFANEAQGRKNIRWAIIRQAPYMNKTRQLIFTRLAQVLCTSFLCPAMPVASSLLNTEMYLQRDDVDGERSGGEAAPNKRQNRVAVTVLSALADSGVPQWCYETETQKAELVLFTDLPANKARILDSMLCVRVFRGFVDITSTEEYPTESVLVDSLTVLEKKWSVPYETPQLPDSNYYRFLPVEYSPSLDPGPSPLCTSVDSRTRRLVSDAALTGKQANTLAPICSTLVDLRKFSQAISVFLGEPG